MAKVFDKNGYRIAIEHAFERDAIDIWMFQHCGDEHFFAEPCANGDFFWRKYDPAMPMDRHTSFSIPRELKTLFLEAVCTYADEEGINQTRQEKLEGTLDAQSKHLDDMRALVGKLAKVELGASE